MEPVKVVVTGGGGFLGQKLAKALAESGSLAGRPVEHLTLVDIVEPSAVPAPFSVEAVAADIAEDGVAQSVVAGADVVYHLAAVVSGGAEADFDLGMRVNLFGTVALFEAVRADGQARGVVPGVIYASSLAVHGGEAPDPVPEGAELNPQSSYGTQKAMGELLLQDMSRKGFLDGRGLRLPTVTIRPGKANAAASSFMSSIFRDTLEGNLANCPVDRGYAVFHSAPRTVIANLLHAAEVDGERFGFNRNINLPGRTDTIGAMIDAMDRVAGPEASSRITWEPDEAVQAITSGWRGAVRHDKALSLGFQVTNSFEDSVRWFLEDDMAGVSA